MPAADAAQAGWTTERAVLPGGGRACTVISTRGDLRTRVEQHSGLARLVMHVKVGRNNQPGSLSYLRIDRRMYQTDEERFTGAEAEDIIGRLATSDEFVVEWFRRGFAKRGGLYRTGRFGEAMRACRAWVTGTDI